MLIKIISGGQTGVDQAGLVAARAYGILTGGWLPVGCITSEGPNRFLLEKYGMREHSGGYRSRTRANVRDSDGTLRLAEKFTSPGERCTLRAIFDYDKPHLDVHTRSPLIPEVVAAWIQEHQIQILNIAGNSESTSPGITQWTLNYLNKVFRALSKLEQS